MMKKLNIKQDNDVNMTHLDEKIRKNKEYIQNMNKVESS